jgi:lipopolysaccharide export system permease protein
VLFSLLGLCVLFVIVHLLENLDSFLDKKTPLRIIGIFYLNYLPQIIKLILPIAMLLSSLFTMGRFSNLNELTAMKAGGMSLYRIMLPVLLFGVVVSAAQMYFDAWVVPRANRLKASIEQQYLGKGRTETSLYNVYVRDTPVRNLLVRYYDDMSKTGSNFTLEEYTAEDRPRIVRRVDALSFSYDTVRSVWKLANATEHTFPTPLTTPEAHPLTRFMTSYDLKTNTTPRDLMQLQRNTDELTFPELSTYIDVSERGGRDVRQQRVKYFGEYMLPLANFIVMLFGMPISAGQRKGGLALEITTAMAIAFVYIAGISIGQTIGSSSDVHPALAAAFPHLAFLIAGIVNVLRVQT